MKEEQPTNRFSVFGYGYRNSKGQAVMAVKPEDTADIRQVYEYITSAEASLATRQLREMERQGATQQQLADFKKLNFKTATFVGTVNLNDHPLPYEGAYAQALWLLNHGYATKPNQHDSELITLHNQPYLIPDDVDEALRTFVRMPAPGENAEAYTSGDLLHELFNRGFRGPKFTTQSIGRAMKAMGFESFKRRGLYKYSVVIADAGRQQSERRQDAEDEDAVIW